MGSKYRLARRRQRERELRRALESTINRQKNPLQNEGRRAAIHEADIQELAANEKRQMALAARECRNSKKRESCTSMSRRQAVA
jgi:hypothetical protein